MHSPEPRSPRWEEEAKMGQPTVEVRRVETMRRARSSINSESQAINERSNQIEMGAESRFENRRGGNESRDIDEEQPSMDVSRRNFIDVQHRMLR